jgi:hypothetical protein
MISFLKDRGSIHYFLFNTLSTHYYKKKLEDRDFYVIRGRYFVYYKKNLEDRDFYVIRGRYFVYYKNNFIFFCEIIL